MPSKNNAEHKHEEIELTPLLHFKTQIFFKMPEVKITPMPIAMNIFRTPIQSFSNPNLSSHNGFHKMTSALWMLVVSHLPVKELFKIMLVCKGLGELTNSEDIRSQLYGFKMQIEQRKLNEQILQSLSSNNSYGYP